MEKKEPAIFSVVHRLFYEEITFNNYVGMKISRLGYEQISICFDSRPEL